MSTNSQKKNFYHGMEVISNFAKVYGKYVVEENSNSELVYRKYNPTCTHVEDYMNLDEMLIQYSESGKRLCNFTAAVKRIIGAKVSQICITESAIDNIESHFRKEY